MIIVYINKQNVTGKYDAITKLNTYLRVTSRF